MIVGLVSKEVALKGVAPKGTKVSPFYEVLEGIRAPGDYLAFVLTTSENSTEEPLIKTPTENGLPIRVTTGEFPVFVIENGDCVQPENVKKDFLKSVMDSIREDSLQALRANTPIIMNPLALYYLSVMVSILSLGENPMERKIILT
jgi:hypothetical protein